MKNIKIKYNPYLVTTEITVDGNKPKANSSLNVGNKRLQEWIEKLPDIIIEEYRDNSAVIDFTGSKADFEDIQAVLNANKDKFKAEANLNKTADISDVEKEIDCIFQDIQNGPVPELRDKLIVEAFQKAKDSKFEINVVATMSSGKSTLINALLGKQLMPAANEATTATIVKIVDTEQENFSAIAYDKSGNIVRKIDDVTLEDMKELNGDIKVSTVELKGKIPFVSSVGMKLVLVDTPGPNNSRDKSHEAMTYQMISDSDKSLVLYVMNGQQLGINDEKIFLDYVCQSMKEGGKQARERFIFAVNKMDAFNPNPNKDGIGCIKRALNDVKTGLEDRGIYNPNIFPVCSLPALEKRVADKYDSEELDLYKSRLQKYAELHFDNYYEFSNLPETVRARISGFMDNANEDEIVEIHTGIVSIEQAVSQYINKYARTTKVSDLVLAFNDKLNELAAVAHIEEAIHKDKEAKAALEKQIVQIKNNIQSAQNAQARSKSIDNIDLRSVVETEVKRYLDSVKNMFTHMVSKYSNRVNKMTALQECSKLEKECRAVSLQIKIEIDKILDKAYKETINKTINEYKKYLADLNISVNKSALIFNPANIVSASLASISSIVADNTETVDKSYYETRTKDVFVPSTRKWYNPFSWFNEGDHYEKRNYKAKVEKYVEEVELRKVAEEYLEPFQEHLAEIRENAIMHIVSETDRLKKYLKEELAKIDKVLNDKLDALTRTESDSKAKAAEIAQKENNLRWLEGIQKRVNDIIEF